MAVPLASSVLATKFEPTSHYYHLNEVKYGLNIC